MTTNTMKSADRKAIVQSIKKMGNPSLSGNSIFWGPLASPEGFQLTRHIHSESVTLVKGGHQVGRWALNEKDWEYISNQVARTALKS